MFVSLHIIIISMESIVLKINHRLRKKGEVNCPQMAEQAVQSTRLASETQLELHSRLSPIFPFALYSGDNCL